MNSLSSKQCHPEPFKLGRNSFSVVTKYLYSNQPHLFVSWVRFSGGKRLKVSVSELLEPRLRIMRIISVLAQKRNQIC